MKKIDLHTHSILSYDGGIDENGYRKILASGILDYIAITDHNEIAFAQELQKKLGNAIIIGEEIMTVDGEIIGLFLQEKIPSGLSVNTTIQEIKKQKGLVYIPHPLEIQRKGISQTVLTAILKDVDIIEVFNARGFGRDKKSEVMQISQKHHLLTASSSDAHSLRGVGSAFSAIHEEAKKGTMKESFSKAQMHMKYAPFLSYLSPSINKIKKMI